MNLDLELHEVDGEAPVASLPEIVGKKESITPPNIDSMPEEEVLTLLDTFMGFSPKQLMVLAKALYAVLGFTLSNDVLLTLISNVKERLAIAIAGGGKTTFSQIDITFFKMLYAYVNGYNLIKAQVLCLVYNTANVKPMEWKHQFLINRVNESSLMNKKGPDGKIVRRPLDSGITAHTLHAWCLKWIVEYSTELNYKREDLLSGDSDKTNLNSAINVFKKKHPECTAKPDADLIMSLHNLARENFFSDSDILNDHEKLHDLIIECNLPPESIVEIIASYEKLKRMKRKFDFTDCLVIIEKFLRTNDEFRTRMHDTYRYVTVDEVQDFTPLMMSIVRLLVGPNTRLLAIGDEDQSIYAFRGADPDNALNFGRVFPNSVVFTLLTNRRCRSTVLDAARSVIESNTLRYDKRLIAANIGGQFDLVSYSSESEQLNKLLATLKKMDSTERNRTVISFRDRIYCAPITKALYDANIEYQILSGVDFCYTDVFTDFIHVLNLINNPTKVEFFQYMYKVLNVKKEDWLNHIMYNEKKNECKAFPSAKCYWDIDMSPFSRYSGFMESLQWMQGLSLSKGQNLVSSYFDKLFRLFKSNFWTSKSEYNQKLYTTESEEWLKQVFCRPDTFEVIMSNFITRTKYGIRQSRGNGVTLGTFHSLKGLEYGNQHMMYMDDDIFPCFAAIETKPFSDTYKHQLKEGETRLCYVGMTRAIDHLVMYYPITSPSHYVKILRGEAADVPARQATPIDFNFNIASQGRRF